MATNNSKVITLLAKRIPKLFSRESITELVKNNDLSIACAREAAETIDLYENAHERNISTSETVDKMQKLGFFANVKFEAMLESAKEDERLLYDQFVQVDNARNEVMAKIISKKEGDVNALLNSILSLPSINDKEVTELLQVKVRVEDIK